MLALPETPGGSVAVDAAEMIAEAAQAADAVLIGPGLAGPEETGELLAALLPALPPRVRLVLDALVLGCLPGLSGVTGVLGGRALLTPNSAEAARLLDDADAGGGDGGGDGDGGGGEDEAGTATSVAARYGAVTALHGNLVAPDGRRWVDESGHAGLGVSGSGDVLAGIAAGVLARSGDPAQAACRASYLHGSAGDRLAARIGRVGFLARELLDEVPAVLAELETWATPPASPPTSDSHCPPPPPQSRRPRTAHRCAAPSAILGATLTAPPRGKCTRSSRSRARSPRARGVRRLSVATPSVPCMARTQVRAQPRDRPTHRCAECGWQSTKWMGRCSECQAWGTVEQVGGDRLPGWEAGAVAARVSTPARPIAQVDIEAARARPTGVGELDRVLGGGLVPGAVVLLAGEPGVGKSTLLLDVAAKAAADGMPTLYVTGEESAAQVRLRAERIGALHDCLYLAAETDLGTLLGQVEAVAPRLLVVDSVQTIGNAEIDSAPGGVTQVRAVAAALIRVAKERGIAVLLVGHVTKDGTIAGPRVLEHLVDVVLSFEGERHSRLRLVRAVKNRYGPSDEVGCFDLGDDGIVGLADPSGLFLSHRGDPVPGTCVTVAVEGRRPLVAEVQALVAKSTLGTPRRATSGLDAARVSMVLAVLERRGGVHLHDQDVYVATVGGVRLAEPATDLAVALAVASAAADRPLPGELVAIGEVGLAGEVRRVSAVTRRLAEAARLGFPRALVPPDPGRLPDGVRAREVPALWSALAALSPASRG